MPIVNVVILTKTSNNIEKLQTVYSVLYKPKLKK